jgi:hypothetical protein
LQTIPIHAESSVTFFSSSFFGLSYQQANRFFFEGCKHYANIFANTGQSTAVRQNTNRLICRFFFAVYDMYSKNMAALTQLLETPCSMTHRTVALINSVREQRVL